MIAAASAAFTLIGGCAGEADPPADSEAFVGPLSNDLIVSASTDCTQGDVGVGDAVKIQGFDYRPGAEVELRYTVTPGQEIGTWPSLVADDDGEFTTTLRMARTIVQAGDTIVIKAEGAGESGLMQLQTKLTVQGC